MNNIINFNQADKYVKDNFKEALERASEILGKDINQQSFNGIIGGKNKDFNCDVLIYSSPEEYYEAWIKGHRRKYESDKIENGYHPEKSSYRIDQILNDYFLKEFVRVYLYRTYFKEHKIK